MKLFLFTLALLFYVQLSSAVLSVKLAENLGEIKGFIIIVTKFDLIFLSFLFVLVSLLFCINTIFIL